MLTNQSNAAHIIIAQDVETTVRVLNAMLGVSNTNHGEREPPLDSEQAQQEDPFKGKRFHKT